MPEVRYGGKDGRVQRLEVDENRVVVRTENRRSLLSGPVARPEAALLEGMELEMSFPEAGVEVFRQAKAGKRDTKAVREELKHSPAVRFAGRVLVDAESGEPTIYTENLFVKFKDDVEEERCLVILREAGLAVKSELPYATNAYFVEAPEGTGQEIFNIAQRLLEKDEVEYCHPELVQRLGRRAIFPQQWHLQTTVLNGQEVRASANVAAAHALTQGEGVTIAIIDDGFDLDHEELRSPGKIVAPRDFRSSIVDDDPRPGQGDDHGTACAGVACADGLVGASGVAPKARLMPIRMPNSIGSQRIADAFHWAATQGADVISCSWGPADGRWWDPNDPNHNAFVPLPDNVRLAIDFAATQGRGGKGCVVLFAAGNGNESVDNDGYASYQNVLAVAACNDRGRRCVYSDFGKAIFCAFPSSDFAFPPENRPPPLTPGIWTTDRSGPVGYNTGTVANGGLDGNYTNAFGGTSSSCPGAAGVVALVLARNPALRREEVKDVLRRACERIDPQAGQYDAEGRSALYGYGRPDAALAVQLAVPEERPSTVLVARTFNEPIQDLRTSRVGLEVATREPLQDLKVLVDIEHTWIGDLVVTLIPPAATGVANIVLHRREGGRTRNIKRSWDRLTAPGLAAFAGKIPAGIWTLEVRDEARQDTGTIKGFGLELTLAAAAPARGAAARPRRSKPRSRTEKVAAE